MPPHQRETQASNKQSLIERSNAATTLTWIKAASASNITNQSKQYLRGTSMSKILTAPRAFRNTRLMAILLAIATLATISLDQDNQPSNYDTTR
jgi:hypothetical protein